MFGKTITKISRFFFEDVAKIIKPSFSSLENVLSYSNIHENLIEYLSGILFISFLVGLAIEFVIIFLMLKLNIYFNIMSFVISIFISITFATMIFVILYKYPFYFVLSKTKEINSELEDSIRHLHVLQDKSISVADALNILMTLEGNKLLTEETNKILSMADLNKNLKGTLSYVVSHTYSELERDFFRSLIDVLDGKENLNQVTSGFIEDIEEDRRNRLVERRNKTNLLFQVNIFLFFFVLILLLSIFLTPVYDSSIKDILLFVAVIFPIIEFLLIFLLNK